MRIITNESGCEIDVFRSLIFLTDERLPILIYRSFYLIL